MFIKRCLFLVLLSLVSLLMGCEKGDWEEARAADTKAAYERFLEKYPEGRFSEEAQSRLTKLREPDEWRTAKSSGKQRDLRLFLEKYPSGRYASMAQQELTRLEEEEGVSWKSASQKDSVKAYQLYLESYPEEQHADVARAGLDELEDESDWRRAVADDGYQEYLEKHPEGRHADNAREKVEKLRQATVRKVDEAYARMRRSVELARTLETFQGEERIRAANELIFLVGSLRDDIVFFESYASPVDPRREAVAALKRVLDKVDAR